MNGDAAARSRQTRAWGLRDQGTGGKAAGPTHREPLLEDARASARGEIEEGHIIVVLARDEGRVGDERGTGAREGADVLSLDGPRSTQRLVGAHA